MNESEVSKGRRGAGNKGKQSSSLIAQVATDQSNLPALAHALAPINRRVFISLSLSDPKSPCFWPIHKIGTTSAQTPHPFCQKQNET
jgi:hypothetical protein